MSLARTKDINALKRQAIRRRPVRVPGMLTSITANGVQIRPLSTDQTSTTSTGDGARYQ